VCAVAAILFSLSDQPKPSSQRIRSPRATATPMDGVFLSLSAWRIFSRTSANDSSAAATLFASGPKTSASKAMTALSNFMCFAGAPSGDDVAHHFAVHVGQPEVAAAITVGELFVIEAQEIENGGVQVVDVDAVFDGVHAEFIG